jgi:hypothetical protein
MLHRKRLPELLALLAAASLAGSLRAEDKKPAVPAPAAPTPAAKAAEASDDDPSRPRITLTWSTASEVDNYGFFVMRADDEKGPFKALNEKAIPGSGNSDLPREYRYKDFAVVPGRSYHYYLESVSMSGVREKFSPVLKRECCKQVKTPEAPADGKKTGTPQNPKKTDPK